MSYLPFPLLRKISATAQNSLQMKLAIRCSRSPITRPSTFKVIRSVLDRKIWFGRYNININPFHGLQTKQSILLANISRGQQYQIFRSYSTQNEKASRITPVVREALQKFITKRDELAAIFDDPASVPSDKLKKCSVELGEVSSIAENIQAWDAKNQELASIRKSLRTEKDPEILQVMKEDYEQCISDMISLENNLISSLVPKDPADDRNCILEVRAGAGGLEATLFASEMFAMYRLFAQNRGWRWDTIKIDHSDAGGYREASASVMGRGVYSILKYESGVHRVQRVPETETMGRTHTSTITVAVLPEPEDVDIKINPKDLRIDTYRSSGAGGQHVNTTESAVRITHIPTGLTVSIQDERSQHSNKEKAMKVLKSRLFELERERTAAARNQQRTSQIGSGERHERIRTYNFSQDRVTDHRCNTTLHDITGMMEGLRLEEFTESMRAMEREKVLKELK